MKTIFFLFVTAILFMGVSSCKKDDITCTCKVTGPVNATIIYGGPESSDGCGWLIEANGKVYHPTNLSTDFQRNGQEVKVTYELLDEEYVCGFPWSDSRRYQKIKILKIKRR